MDSNSLNLANLIEGFRLSCHTEGKSAKTTEWYTCFLTKFRQFLQLGEIPTDAGQKEAIIGHLLFKWSFRPPFIAFKWTVRE